MLIADHPGEITTGIEPKLEEAARAGIELEAVQPCLPGLDWALQHTAVPSELDTDAGPWRKDVERALPTDIRPGAPHQIAPHQILEPIDPIHDLPSWDDDSDLDSSRGDTRGLR